MLLLPLLLSGALALAPADTTLLPDLPLVEVPATAASSTRMAILMTGDGDWADFVQQTAQRLAARGIPVVGLKARSYMGRKPTPEQAAADVARIITAYTTHWQRSSVLLIGYSRGADWVPFILNRLPAPVRSHVALGAMLGLAERGSFTFHLTDLMRETSRSDDIPLAPELARLRGARLLCIYGADEEESGCRGADPSLMTIVGRSGGHHFDRDYDAIVTTILDAVPK